MRKVQNSSLNFADETSKINLMGEFMKISVLHIGKTGGTALLSALQDEKDDKDLVFHGHGMTLKKLWEKFPQRKVIFGVRNPVERYVSAFNSRLRQGKPRHFTAWSKSEEIAFSMFKTPNELAEALTSNNDWEKAAAKLSMLGINHVNKPLDHTLVGVKYLKENISKLYFVYLVEVLDDDFNLLKRVLKINDAVMLPSDDVAAHRTPTGMSKSLSERAEQNIRQWYQQDIELYQFCKVLHDQRVAELAVR